MSWTHAAAYMSVCWRASCVQICTHSQDRDRCSTHSCIFYYAANNLSSRPAWDLDSSWRKEVRRKQGVGVKYERRDVEKGGECEDKGRNTLFATLFFLSGTLRMFCLRRVLAAVAGCPGVLSEWHSDFSLISQDLQITPFAGCLPTH